MEQGLLILTEAVTENPEIAETVEETFDLVQTLNDNVGVVLVCITVVGLAIYALVRFLDKKKKRR